MRLATLSSSELSAAFFCWADAVTQLGEGFLGRIELCAKFVVPAGQRCYGVTYALHIVFKRRHAWRLDRASGRP